MLIWTGVVASLPILLLTIVYLAVAVSSMLCSPTRRTHALRVMERMESFARILRPVVRVGRRP